MLKPWEGLNTLAVSAGSGLGFYRLRSTSRSSATPANPDEVNVLRARLAAQEAAQEALGSRKQCSVCGAGSAIGSNASTYRKFNAKSRGHGRSAR
jgi:hypothetical protein